MKKGIINELKVSFLIDDIDKYRKVNGDKETVEKYEQKILNLNNARLSFEFALIEGSDINAHENVVVKSNDLGYIYYFARYIEGSNKERLSNIIINSKDVVYNYLYALYVKNADIRRHGNVIIESKDLKYNYLFIKDVKGADIEKHSEVLVNSEDSLYLKSLKKSLRKDCNIDLPNNKKKILK